MGFTHWGTNDLLRTTCSVLEGDHERKPKPAFEKAGESSEYAISNFGEAVRVS